jgi:hypothetical protein
MTTSTAAVAHDRQDERKRKRAAIAKFSLAGAALVGIAAAATSAAWTDDAWFSASGSAVASDGVELQGSLTDVDSSGVAITIPPAELAGMVPNETRDFEVYVRNDGDVDLSVDATIAATGLLADATISTDFADDTVLAPSTAGTLVTVTVVADDWTTAAQGTTGGLTLRFSGSTVD